MSSDDIKATVTIKDNTVTVEYGSRKYTFGINFDISINTSLTAQGKEAKDADREQ